MVILYSNEWIREGFTKSHIVNYLDCLHLTKIKINLNTGEVQTQDSRGWQLIAKRRSTSTPSQQSSLSTQKDARRLASTPSQQSSLSTQKDAKRIASTRSQQSSLSTQKDAKAHSSKASWTYLQKAFVHWLKTHCTTARSLHIKCNPLDGCRSVAAYKDIYHVSKC